MAKPARRKKRALTAKTADKHVLYEKSVQCPDFEVEFASRLFKRRAGRTALVLREDFCGTALLCAEWVQSRPDRRAIGVDLDPKVLAWGRAHNVEPLGEAAARITLLRGDVRTSQSDPCDVLMALNYSYFIFKDRPTLRGYFESARHNLATDGLFILDLFGGWEAYQCLEEERKVERFRYVWHQAKFNPITHDFLAHIHFRFSDGTALSRAFTYDWRLWTLPELQELLREAGFTKVDVLFESEDEDGDGTGTFRPRRTIENTPGYNAYLVASMASR